MKHLHYASQLLVWQKKVQNLGQELAIFLMDAVKNCKSGCLQHNWTKIALYHI